MPFSPNGVCTLGDLVKLMQRYTATRGLNKIDKEINVKRLRFSEEGLKGTVPCEQNLSQCI